MKRLMLLALIGLVSAVEASNLSGVTYKYYVGSPACQALINAKQACNRAARLNPGMGCATGPVPSACLLR